jgi:hypothetical protein
MSRHDVRNDSEMMPVVDTHELERFVPTEHTEGEMPEPTAGVKLTRFGQPPFGPIEQREELVLRHVLLGQGCVR